MRAPKVALYSCSPKGEGPGLGPPAVRVPLGVVGRHRAGERDRRLVDPEHGQLGGVLCAGRPCTIAESSTSRMASH